MVINATLSLDPEADGGGGMFDEEVFGLSCFF
jgi:hypothetical protein